MATEQNSTHTPGQAWDGDNEFEEAVVTKADGNADRGWSITKDDGWSFWVPADSPVEPKAGTKVRMYGRGIGSRVRGLFLDGQRVFYRTESDDAEHSANDLYGKDAADVLARWDAGRGIWSVAMGGFGPGYEQALQIAAMEVLRHLVSGGSAETAEPSALGHLGLSGAQWGAARGLAVAIHTKGPRALLEMYADDRHIQVSKRFPASPDPLRDAAPDMLSELRKQIDWLRHIRPQLTGKVPGSVINGLDQSVKYMTAAIAKAEGR